MWILTNEGDLYGGKRLWLPPRTTHLLGRTTGKSENGERIRYIDQKNVSRKHLTIKVHAAEPGSGLKVYQRSKVEVTDGSKTGTKINDEKITQTTKTLEGNTHFTIKLGNFQDVFHLEWHPVVLSTSGIPKFKLPAQRQKLEAADIKLLKDYVSNETTHSVSTRRNTPSNLQALVQGKWLVSDAYVDALCEAVAWSNLDEGGSLEIDFDANWPKEKDYVAPTGTEPVKRPDEFCLPNPERSEVFSDFSFLFMSQSQYDNLLPVITSGGGKALLWEIEIGQSKVEDLVEYIKSVAGKKGSSQFNLSQVTGPGGVVLVDPNVDDTGVKEFVNGVETTIRQRPIVQNELLDVILSLDTSSLRQPSEKTPPMAPPARRSDPSPSPAPRASRQSQRAVTVNDTPPTQQEPAQNPPPPAEQPSQRQAEQTEQPATASKRRHRRYITQSRFKGFDDDDDDDAGEYSAPVSQSPAPSFDQAEPSQAASAQDMDVDEPSQPSQPTQTQRNPRKRPAPQVEEPDEDAMYEELLPGHAAMKRQKTKAAARNGNQATVLENHVAATKVQAKKKKAKELDVMAEVQKRREKEEEERRKDEESLRDQMNGVNLSELKNLAQVEEMEIPVRQRPARTLGENAHDERWDPSWNGRKNFKKFRPQGSTQNGPRLQRVIVSLEEVARKGHGIGEEYWLQITHGGKSKSKSKSQSQSHSQSIRRGEQSQPADTIVDDEHQDSTGFRRRIQQSRQEDEEDARANELHPEEIAGRARDEALAEAVAGSPSQTQRGSGQGAKKRPAAAQATGGPAKKARQTRIGAGASTREVVDLEEEDDGDDALKFRRRRR